VFGLCGTVGQTLRRGRMCRSGPPGRGRPLAFKRAPGGRCEPPEGSLLVARGEPRERPVETQPAFEGAEEQRLQPRETSTFLRLDWRCCCPVGGYFTVGVISSQSALARCAPS